MARGKRSNMSAPSSLHARSSAPLAMTAGLLLLAGCQASEARLALDAPAPASASTTAPTTDELVFSQDATPQPATPSKTEPAAEAGSAPAASEAAAKDGDKAKGDDPAKDKWQLQVTPYVWLAGIQGTVIVNSLGFPVQREFSDLTNNLDFGGSLRFEARKKHWSVLFDSNYFDFSTESPTLMGNADIGLKTLFLELDVGYTPKSAPGLVFLIGARALDVEQSFSAPIGLASDESTTLIDPIVGAQGAWRLGNHFLFSLRGDIGGFGVGSEFTSQLNGYFRWAFSKVGGLDLGYRMYTYNVDQDNVNFDVRIAGPTFGLDFRF